MDKFELIDFFRNKIKPEYFNEFLNYTKSPFYKYIKNESLFQFFVTRYLDSKNVKYVLLQNEGKKTAFEKFLSLFVGNKKGWSDLFVPELKLFLELKSETPFLKSGKLKKTEHLLEQQNFLNEMINLGYKGFFLYPENFNELVKLI